MTRNTALLLSMLPVLASADTMSACKMRVGGPVVMSAGPPAFSFDLTQPVLSLNLTTTRTGGNIYAARTNGTAAAVVSGADVYESKDDGAGHWVFDAYTNGVPPTDFSTGAGWTYSNTPLMLLGGQSAPDGTLTATGMTDTSASVNPGISFTGSDLGVADIVSSIWVRDDISNPPTSSGAVYPWTTNNQNLDGFRDPINSFGSGDGWRRVSASYGGWSIPTIYIEAAGSSPISLGAGTETVSAVGGVFLWGAQSTAGVVDLPTVVGSTGALQMTAASGVLPKILNSNGDLDIEVAFMGEYFVPRTLAMGDGWLWSMETPSGTYGVDAHDFYNYRLNAKGSATSLDEETAVNYKRQEFKVRAFYRPSDGYQGVKVSINGAYEDYQKSTGATGTIGTPTSFYVGSNVGSNIYARRYTAVRRSNLTIADLDKAEGVIIGDSTSAHFASSTNFILLGGFIYTTDESRSRPGIHSIAVQSQTAVDQLAVWQACPQRGSANVKWVSVQVGLNDIHGSATESQTVARIQAIIDDINTNNPTATVLLIPMTPAAAHFTTPQLAIWTAVNNDIVGTGSLTFTGSNLIRLPLWSQLDDGTGQMRPQYYYDGVHGNAAARIVNAGVIRSTLIANGLL